MKMKKKKKKKKGHFFVFFIHHASKNIIGIFSDGVRWEGAPVPRRVSECFTESLLTAASGVGGGVCAFSRSSKDCARERERPTPPFMILGVPAAP